MATSSRNKRAKTVRTGVDTGRLAAAVSRPGIDPRIWVANATVMELGYDAQNGLYADVQLQPSGDVETCMLGTPYARPNAGLWFPVSVGDRVLVCFPMGDPNQGPVIFARLWSAQLVPAAQLGNGDEPSTDVVLVVEKGVNLKIFVSGGGNVAITAADSSQVNVQTDSGAISAISNTGTITVQSPMVALGTSSDQLAVARTTDLAGGMFPVAATTTSVKAGA